MSTRKSLYIWDLDGTLADYSHRAHHLNIRPVNWPLFFEKLIFDKPIAINMSLFRLLAKQENGVTAICTARPDTYRDQTRLWLRMYKARPDILLMRKADDTRDDVLVKRDMLEELRTSYNLTPVLALDDRAPIVRMYREQGVPCFHVAEGGDY